MNDLQIRAVDRDLTQTLAATCETTAGTCRKQKTRPEFPRMAALADLSPLGMSFRFPARPFAVRIIRSSLKLPCVWQSATQSALSLAPANTNVRVNRAWRQSI